MKRTRRRKTTKTKRTIGVSLGLALLLFSFAAWGGDRKPAEESAVVAGTVFRDPGFALPNAEVTLSVTEPPAGAKVPKSQKAVANFRGEFSFRVPPVKALYLVTARASGFLPQQQPAAISGGPERIEVNLTLTPEPSKGK